MPQIAPGAQILVVDDSSQVREVLRELLDRYGHTVVCCEDGESGLVELETRRFDLVIESGDAGKAGVHDDQGEPPCLELDPTRLAILAAHNRVTVSGEELAED